MKIKKIGVLFILVFAGFLTSCNGEKSAKSYYKDGMKYYKEGNYEAAEKSLLCAVKKNPNKAEYIIDYGMTLIKDGDYSEALTQLDKAIIDKDNKVIKENDKKAHRGKGIAYYEMADYENAIEEFETALKISELEDLNMDILYYKGDSEEKAGKYEAAIDTYTTIMKDNKKDVTIFCTRAHAYSELEDYDAAFTDYDKAIAIEPKNQDLYFQKYSLYKKQDDVTSGIKVLDKALKITKDKDYYNLGRIYYYKDDIEQAITNFNKAVEEETWESYFYLGEIYGDEKDYEQAIENYKNYLKKIPNSKEGIIYNQLATCLIATKEYQEALDYIQQGIKKEDSSAMRSLKYNEIVAYERLIMFDEAYDKIKAYLLLYPEDEAALKEIEFIKTRVKSS